MKALIVIGMLAISGNALAGYCILKEHPYTGGKVQTKRYASKGSLAFGTDELAIWPSYIGGHTQRYRFNVTRNSDQWAWIKNKGVLGHVVIDGERIELPFVDAHNTEVNKTAFTYNPVVVKERTYAYVDEELLKRIGDKNTEVRLWIGGYDLKITKGEKKLFRRFMAETDCIEKRERAFAEILD